MILLSNTATEALAPKNFSLKIRKLNKYTAVSEPLFKKSCRYFSDFVMSYFLLKLK